ncbi:type II toxin-antitoxin system RelB/DinJ family antitoxin [Shewanella sp.]|uniref:type II toxin-antitoxin system RelB/DinJ family antitoxin n=1 Tax=Shewanella sp. TaxID=50422 RepID=UPI004053C664
MNICRHWNRPALNRILCLSLSFWHHYYFRNTALEKLGVTASDLLRQTLEYVAQQGKLPFKPMLLTDEVQALIELARSRLLDPHYCI